jgi:hypothetical protein
MVLIAVLDIQLTLIPSAVIYNSIAIPLALGGHTVAYDNWSYPLQH